jgi:hypothetical protein
MKNSIQKNITRLLVFICLTTVVACKNKSEDDSAPNNPAASTGKFALHLHAQIGESEVETYDSVYTNADGRKMTLSLAQFYISEIQLVKLDGSKYEIPDTRILKTLDEDIFEVGNVPAGNYQSVSFKVGLVPAINQLMPNASSDSSILNHPEMWFGEAAQPNGYVFMRVKGGIDTTAHLSGNALTPFDISIGTNAHLVQVSMPVKNFSVVPGSTTYTHILTDYGKLFSGINLSESNNLMLTTSAANAGALATQLSNNISSMFGYEE